MKLRAFLPAVIAATCILAPSAAQAFTFQIGPNSCSSQNASTRPQIGPDGCSNDGEPTGASVQLTFDFTQEGDDVWLNLGIINTTGTEEVASFGSGATEATLMGVAFDFASGVAFDSFEYDPLSSGEIASIFTGEPHREFNFQPFSNQGRHRLGAFDVGIGTFTGANPQGGLKAGKETQVQFSFSPSTAGSSLAASEFAQAFEQEIRNGNLKVAARFQEVNAGGGSDRLLGGQVLNGDRPTQVPEPAAIGALGLTAAGLGLLKKKQAADASDQGASV